MIKITMDNGVVYKSDWSIYDFMSRFYTEKDIPNAFGTKNKIKQVNINFLEIKEGVFVYPKHISSVEKIEKKTPRVARV